MFDVKVVNKDSLTDYKGYSFAKFMDELNGNISMKVKEDYPEDYIKAFILEHFRWFLKDNGIDASLNDFLFQLKGTCVSIIPVAFNESFCHHLENADDGWFTE